MNSKRELMNLTQYRSMRQMELQRVFEQRQFLGFIAKHMPSVNHTALRKFSDAHIKSTQMRMYYIRISYYLVGEGDARQAND